MYLPVAIEVSRDQAHCENTRAISQRYCVKVVLKSAGMEGADGWPSEAAHAVI